MALSLTNKIRALEALRLREQRGEEYIPVKRIVSGALQRKVS